MAGLRVMMGLLLCALSASAEEGARRPLPFTGVNLAGGEFYGPKPGVRPVANRNFVYPNAGEVEYFAGHGMNIFRYPFRWETLQPEAGKPLLQDEVDRLKAAVNLATGRKLVVILDPHNCARHYGKGIGSPEVRIEEFADFWKRLAAEFAGDPYVWFGLMNEPHGLPTKVWFDAANAAIAAIRAAGARNTLLVPGNAFSGAHSWTATWYGESNASHAVRVHDPLDRWAIEVHQYLDKDSSGSKPEVVSPTIGSERLKAFVEWCRANKRRAFLGEFGAAANPAAQQALGDMLAGMERDRDVWLGWAWWAAGAWWGNYMFSIEPKDGQDKPQMAWLKPHLHGGTVSALP